MTDVAHPVIRIRLAALLLLLVGCAWPQTHSSALPRFEDYPAREIYAGTLAAPKLATPLEQTYADRITVGVDAEGKKGPNFAGDLIVIQWSCGAPCVRMAVVDARSGEVHNPPISASGIGAWSFDLPLLTAGYSYSQNPEVRFRPNSSLMIVKATPNWWSPRRHPSFTYYFLWRQNRWTLLRKVPLDSR
jgi:hypothetical protein